jgi:hypothetical protein
MVDFAGFPVGVDHDVYVIPVGAPDLKSQGQQWGLVRVRGDLRRDRGHTLLTERRE